jgi:pimeloyl-ACP methyl ester carboxylesterase
MVFPLHKTRITSSINTGAHDLASDQQFAKEAAQMPFPRSANWTQGPNIPPDNELLTIISQQRPGVVDAHLDLWFDYGSNMPLYPAWQNLLKSLNVPVEVIWGSHDNYFTVPGALAYSMLGILQL